MGNYDLIGQREIQDMSVGSRIHHSEYNASDSAEAPVLQIWIEPGKNGIAPEYTKICSVMLLNPESWDCWLRWKDGVVL
jgi:Pirin-related protein